MNDQAVKLRALAGAGMFDAVAIEGNETPLPHGKRCTSIAVTSGKGGVGKTNIALSLGCALARMKKRVLIFDGDLGLANLHLLLGVAPERTLLHVVRGESPLEAIIWQGPMGVDILPGASGVEEMANLDTMSILRLLRSLSVCEQQYDFLIVDTAAGIGTSVTRFAASSDCALVVLTPEPTSLADAYATTKILFERGANRVAAVVNMAMSGREGAETFDRLNALVVKFLGKSLVSCGTVLYEKEVQRSVRKQRLLLADHPGGRFSERMQTLAWKVSGMNPVLGTTFFSRLWSRAG